MVEVFRTNVHDEGDSQYLLRHLQSHFPDGRINFDLEDCDRILRVESSMVSRHKIMDTLSKFGFWCEALD